MGKTYLIVILVFIFFITSNIAATSEDKYDIWLKKEVDLIITKVEKEEFKKLETPDEKEYFIKLFWARRDPTPQTERNEFKEEYYRRLDYIQGAFLYGYKRGLETDEGKVYLFFGKPKVFPQKDIEVWIYPSQPWMKLPKPTFSVVFHRVDVGPIDLDANNPAYSGVDMVGYALDRQQTDNRVMQAFYAYPNQILLNPDMKKLPEYEAILSFLPDSFEGKLIDQVESSQEDITQIPLEMKALSVKAENQSSYLTLLLEISPGAKSKFLGKKTIFFGRIESDSYSQDFRVEKDLVEERESLISQVGLPIIPGEYKLFYGFYSKDKKFQALRLEKITIPSYWDNELAISSILASPQVTDSLATKPTDEYNVFRLGRYLLYPFFSQEYTKQDILNVFYYIYNPTLDADQKCFLHIEFELKKGEKIFKLNPQKRQQKMNFGDAILDGTQFPLSVLPELGKYELIVKVTDEVSQTTATQSLKFTLLK